MVQKRIRTNIKLVKGFESIYMKWTFFLFLFEMERDRRVLCRVQLTRPPLTELNQCAFSSDSYLFYSAPDIWNALFRTFVLRTKSRSTFIFVSVASWAGETFIITELNSVLSRLIPLSAGHSSIKWFAVWSSSSQRSQMGSWSGSHFEMWYLKGPWPVTNLTISPMSFLCHVLKWTF